MRNFISLLAVTMVFITAHLSAQPLKITSPNGGEDFPVRFEKEIRWGGVSKNQQVRLEYSTDSGNSWLHITDATGNVYKWTVPNTPSPTCLARASITALQDPLFMEGTKGSFWSVAFNNSGSRTVLSNANSIIFNAWTGEPIMEFRGAGDPMWAFFNSDESNLVTVDHWRGLSLWDISTGEEYTGTSSTYLITDAVSLSNGERFAGLSGKYVYIWSLEDKIRQEIILLETSQTPRVFAFSPDEMLIATAGFDGVLEKRTVEIWTSDGTPVQSFIGHINNINAVVFSPDGKYVASAGRDSSVYFWNLETGKQERIFNSFHAEVNDICFSPDGQLFATAAADGNIALWDPQTGELIKEWKGYSDNAVNVLFSPDGTRLLTGGNEGGKIWPIGTYTISDVSDAVWTISPEPFDLHVTLPNGGETLVVNATAYLRWEGVADKRPLRLEYSTNGGESWILITRKTSWGSNHAWKVPPTPSHNCLIRASISEVFPPQLLQHLQVDWTNRGIIETVLYHPEGTQVATFHSKGTVELWDPLTGEHLQTLESPSLKATFGGSFSPDGRRLVAAFYDGGEIRVWDLQTGETLFTLETEAGATDADYSPDGSLIAVGGSLGTGYIWDALTGKLLHTLIGHTNEIESVDFSSDGSMLATASRDQTVSVWSSDGKHLRSLVGHTQHVYDAEFSPDGRYIASTGMDSTVRIWDAETGDLIRTLGPVESWLNSVTFSPDGEYIAAGIRAGLIKLWKVSTGVLHQEWSTSPGVRGLAFSPDGKRLIGGELSTTAKIWTVEIPDVTIADTSDQLWKIVFPASAPMEQNSTLSPVQVLSIYPNPAFSEGQVEMQSSHATEVQMTIIDIQGRTVADVFDGKVQPGRQTFNFSVDGLSSGTYFLLLNRGSNLSTYPFNIVRP